ncbi:MAG TPA: amino acid adenylation domain-containing protein [Longimicrobium sp.]|jgi:amino acid adenylation domain-containing protein
MTDDLSAACIHRLFERQADATPHRPAVRCRGEQLTYAELDQRANRLAHRLRALGVGPEVPVGVLLPRTADLLVAIFAVLKAGGAYLPLDPAYPPERIAYMLADTRAPVLVTDAARAGSVAGYTGEIVRIDAEREEIDRLPAARPDAAVHPENLAYVIYTSGSTGRPKGVQIEHRSAVHLLRWFERFYPAGERETMLAASSVCFDASIPELFGPLASGGTVALVDNVLALAGEVEPVTAAFVITSAAGELLGAGRLPPTLRTLAVGGEAMAPDVAERLRALGRSCRVMHFYGPSEDTTYSTGGELTPGEGPVSVGRPLPGKAVHLLDSGLHPVGPGEAGEVWVAGAGLARGYAGSPALTADRFRPDPHAGAPGARMYRTGDLGRLDERGELEILGRADEQVKVRGFRVEPGEVEAALRAHPAVADAAAAARGEGGAQLLAAYVVPAGEAPDPGELRRFVGERLPDYMVPGAIVFLPALPRLPNGKVDRAALPAPAPAARGEYVAPRTEAEAALAAIWAEVLGVERVGATDAFLDLGGHSLAAVRIASRVRERLGAELSLADLFAMPTVAELARRVAAPAERAAAAIPRAPREGPIPLSIGQEAVWFFQQLVPGTLSYHFQAAVRVSGALDVPALERTLGEIVRRHEIFRTTFPEADGAPVQRIHAPWAVHLPVTDLGHLPEDEREAELRRRFQAEFRRPFDLAALPLVRWTLYRLADDRHVLLVVEHHLVHDGWSFGIFLRELVALYSAFLRGLPSPLPEPRVQYADYAAWQRAWMETDEAREQLDWWREKLEGAPPVLELPADRPRPSQLTARGGSLRLALPPRLYAGADAYGRARGVTLFMTLFAAFEALLHRYTGEADFCVGSAVANRHARETEELVGMLVNTIPVRADLSGDPAFHALVERVRGEAMEAYAREEVPFARIVAEVHPERSLGHLPVYQVAFSFHHAPYPELRLPGATLDVEEGLGNQSAKFDLNVIAIVRAQQGAGDEVVMIWEWAEDLFDESTVRRMAGHFETLLDDALARPDEPVSRLRLLPPGEERRLVALGGAPTPYPREATVHALFREQARRTPGAVAVRDRRRSLTCAELDAEAGRLARRLRALGVGPESRVGVAMERSADMVVAFLAVLQAGGAYVPLDPDHPAERLAWVLDQSRAAALVVRGEVPPSLASFAGPVVSLAGLAGHPAEALADGEGAPAFAQSLACVLYTSGSTGTPKGIAIVHRGIVRVVRDSDYLRLSETDVVAQATTPSFDVSLWEIWGTLLAGGRLVVFEREELLSPPVLAQRLREERVSALFLTPTALRQTVGEVPDAFSSVAHLLLGGEALEAPVLERVLRDGAPGRILNVYGPTESTTYASWHVVDRVEPGAASVPIGVPVANTRLYVLDEAMRPVPEGVAGELYIGGDGLARGYLDRPAMTAERFVPDPVSGEAGARLYRTGDKARWLASGVLDYLGRLDHQVKVRGFRVEIGEVEAVLRAHPAVAEAAVVVRRDDAGDRWLAAYVAGANGRAPEPAELREALSARLPAYMVPSAFVVVDRVPTTPSGKIDRRALPAADAAVSAAPFAEPATPTERVMAEIWREVLDVERVGADDDFFDLGGHSLRATRIVWRVQTRLGVKLAVGAIFANPTVRTLAARVDELRGPAPVDDEALVAWIEGLSEEEAERLLAEGAVGDG